MPWLSSELMGKMTSSSSRASGASSMSVVALRQPDDGAQRGLGPHGIFVRNVDALRDGHQLLQRDRSPSAAMTRWVNELTIPISVSLRTNVGFKYRRSGRHLRTV